MSSTDVFRVVMAQINLVVGDVAGNARRIVEAVEQSRDTLRANLVVFPELTLTGYPPEDLLLRPEFIDRAERALAELMTSVVGVNAIVGHPRRIGAALYNAASVVSDGRVIATYHKHRLPNYAVFDEKRYFEAGSESCVVKLGEVRVGLTICEDIWDSGPARQAVDAGAELLVNLNASPYHTGKDRLREEVMGARAREAGRPLVYVNLVGGQDELVFDGGSQVVDSTGGIVRRSEFFEERLDTADFDLRFGLPVPRPGAIAAQDDEPESIYRAVVLGVRDYVQKNGFDGAVLGLSGGIDSALTLAVAVDALGAENVQAVLMPSRYTAEMSLVDAEAQCSALGVEHETLSIEPSFQAFQDTLRPLFSGLAVDTTEENIQARCRGIILMAISNKFRRLVLSTSNKSETAVGYATLYGDMAGGFAPIKDVPKTMVYRLARYRNASGLAIPQRVLERAPSAELRPDQKDEDSLPAYDILDSILSRYVEQDRSVDEIVADGFDREVVERIARLVIVNEYKRRQSAPGVRISPRAFGRDRRYPISSGFKF